MRPARTLMLSVVLMLSILGLWILRPEARGAGPEPAPALHLAPASRGPVVVIQTEPGKPIETLAVVKAEISVAIAGPLAQTTQILTFRNDTARILEGELVFPLPEGATISGYGLDVDGQIVDAVPVEKQEARIIFEKEVRKGVDPGLVEFVQGNNFRTRLYPIRANSTRTVKIEYVSDLVTTGDKAQSAYHLPLNFQSKLDLFQLRIEVVKGAAKPEIHDGGEALGNFAFKEQDGKYVALLAGEQMQPKNDLVIALPQLAAAQVMVEKDEAGKNTYFVISDIPTPSAINMETPKPRRVGIAWDASIGRANADKSREFAVLSKLLKGLGDVEVDLVVFRDAAEPPLAFHVRNGDASELITHLKAFVYDGATNLGDVAFPTKAPWPGEHAAATPPVPYAYWLLFTDGLVNLGRPEPKTVEAPVYAITSATSADFNLLRHVAEQSGGGQMLNLVRLTDEQAVAAIGAPVFSFLKAEFDPKEIAEVTPAATHAVEGRFTLAGRLLVPEAKITLHYGLPGSADTTRVPFTIKQSDAVTAGGMIPRYWAQQKVAELALLADQNHDELLQLGRQFNLVTPNTSLLVLETLEQHLQYSIPPARSRTDLYNKYLAEIEKRDAAVAKTRGEKLDQVVKMWTEKVKWWEMEFKYDKGFVWKDRPGDPNGVDSSGATTQPAGMVLAVRNFEANPMPLARDPAAPAPSAAPDASGQAIQGEGSHRPSDGALTGGRRLSHSVGGADGYVVWGATDTDDKIKDSDGSAAAAIQIKPWDPKTPYMEAIKNAGKGAADVTAYEVYLQQRAQYGASPAFYLDVGDYLLRQGQRDLGIRVLTNIVEMKLQNPALLRVAAYRLQQEVDPRSLDLAIDLFEKVLRLRPEEPQSYRDLALALATRADRVLAFYGKAKMSIEDRQRINSQAAMDYERALDLLNEVVVKPWDNRFPEIENIALMDFNGIATKVDALAKVGALGKPISNPLDSRLRKLLDVDVRIVLTWDADATDVDLWVTEPTGETCIYNHPRTTIGGALSKDFTQGYGPEEYCLRRALAGKYIVKANYFGSRQQTLSGPCTVRATVITNFGRADETRQDLTLRLTEQKETSEVGTITIGERPR